MKLTIEDMCGMWRAQLDHRSEFGVTLEELLFLLAPDSPEEYVWHTAEVLGGILGAEAVTVDYSGEALDAIFAALVPFDGDDPHPDEFPRGA